MKRISLILLALLAIVPTISARHLQFLGVDIDGSIQNVANNLSTRGFSSSSLLSSYNSDVNHWMEGYLDGKHVFLLINASPVSHTVYAVSVSTFCSNEADAKADWAQFVNYVEENYNFDSSYPEGDYFIRYQNDIGAAVIYYQFSDGNHIPSLMLMDMANLDINNAESPE